MSRCRGLVPRGLVAIVILAACSPPPAEVQAPVSAEHGRVPELDLATRQVNQDLKYTLIGWEPSARRFWVVASRRQVDDGAWRELVLVALHGEHSARLQLDAMPWNVSFFANETDAHYKPFPENSYLGEYYSCRARDPEARNRINIRPYNARWKPGPRALECASANQGLQLTAPHRARRLACGSIVAGRS